MNWKSIVRTETSLSTCSIRVARELSYMLPINLNSIISRGVAKLVCEKADRTYVWSVFHAVEDVQKEESFLVSRGTRLGVAGHSIEC